MNDFYVYEWYNINTNEVFYVGKGRKNRYKNKTQRNKLFLQYIQNNEVDSRIVVDNLSEEDSFKKEKELTEYYKRKNQCHCNLAPAGKGGTHFQWTKEMREYKSIYNPMKQENQKERMRKHNPMFNQETAKKNGEKHQKPLVIGTMNFQSLKDAAVYFNVSPQTIRNWINKGFKTDTKEICYFVNKDNLKDSSSKGYKVLIDNIEYPSLAKAAIAIQVSAGALRQAIKENRKCKNHICSYVNQQPSQ